MRPQQQSTATLLNNDTGEQLSTVTRSKEVTDGNET